jgi:hypothetical protein
MPLASSVPMFAIHDAILRPALISGFGLRLECFEDFEGFEGSCVQYYEGLDWMPKTARGNGDPVSVHIMMLMCASTLG